MIWLDMAWYDDMVWYDMIWYDMTLYYIIVYDIISYHISSYYMLLHDIVWHYMISYDIIWYDIIWRSTRALGPACRNQACDTVAHALQHRARHSCSLPVTQYIHTVFGRLRRHLDIIRAQYHMYIDWERRRDGENMRERERDQYFGWGERPWSLIQSLAYASDGIGRQGVTAER